MGKEYQQEEDVSVSCISSEPTMQAEVSSSTLRASEPKEHEGELQVDEISVRESLVKMCATLVLMLLSYVAILAPGSAEALLHSIELYRLLNGMRARVRISGSVYSVLHAVDKSHLAIGSAAVFVLASVIYFGSRKKQKNANTSSVEKSAIVETRSEMPCENEELVCSGSNPPETNVDAWEPVSALEVKLQLEYSAEEMSSSEKTSPPENCVEKYERRPRRKSMSAITHNVITRDSSVGSSPSYDKSRDKTEVGLRRSSRIRNKVMSPPSAGRVLISSRG